MKKLLSATVLVILPGIVAAQSGDPEPRAESACHMFIDEKHIWTLEVVPDENGAPTPILNIINFTRVAAEMRPADIHVADALGEEASIERFSIDTGVAGEPYLTPFLKLLPNSFIGIDLIGDFEAFASPARVFIDLAPHRFRLAPVDCMDFEMLVEKINQVNFNSPDVSEDFWVLKIEPLGKREQRPGEP